MTATTYTLIQEVGNTQQYVTISLLFLGSSEVTPGGGSCMLAGGGRLLPREVKGKLVVVNLTVPVLVTPDNF